MLNQIAFTVAHLGRQHGENMFFLLLFSAKIAVASLLPFAVAVANLVNAF